MKVKGLGLVAGEMGPMDLKVRPEYVKETEVTEGTKDL